MKHKLFKSWLMLVCLLFGVGTSWAESITVDNATKVEQNGITIEFGIGDGSTAPKYQDAGFLRLYAKNTITISCENAISGISFDWTRNSSKAFASVSASTGNYTHPSAAGTGTWSGSANSIVFTVGDAGQIQIATLEVTVGGSSTPTPATYNVNVATVEGGTISASPTSATADTEVTLSATPADGYEFGSWNVTNASTNAAITVTDNKFKMPAANVNVSATFNEVQGGGDDTPSGDEATASFIFNTEAGLNALGIAKPNTGAGRDIGTDVLTSGTISMSATDGGTKTRVWNSSGNTSLRVYKAASGDNKPAGSLTFSGATITKIEFTGSAMTGFAANTGEYSDGTWTGSATSVTFTASANVTVNTITVTYASNGDTPEPPATDPEIPNFIKTSAIELEIGAANYDVRECLNIPSDYDADTYAITTTINGLTQKDGEFACVYPYLAFQKAGTYTVTVKAAAMPGKYAETTGTITVTVKEPVVTLATMDEVFAAATAAGSTATACNVKLNNWVVSGLRGTSNVYVTDNAGKGFIIFANNHGFKVGDVLSGTVSCKVQLYNGASELTALTASTEGLVVTSGGIVTPVTSIDLADLSGVNTGAVISYTGLQYNGTDFTDGTTSIKPYNAILNPLPTLISGKTYNVTGVYVQFKETKEIAPRTEDDIVLVETVNNYKVTYSTTEHGTIVVKNGDNVVNDGDEIAEGTVLTIECTPENEDYRFKNWQYKAGEDAWTTKYSATQDYTMPSANVQFRANFELIPVYAINWSVNGEVVKTENVKEGAAVSAPEVGVINEMVFTGWVTSETVDADETPEYVKPATATADATYYAVFADCEEGTGSQTTEITYETENIPGSYGASTDVELNGITFNVTQMYKNGEKMQWRAKGNKNGTGAMYNVTPIEGIQSIAITYSSSDTNKNFTVNVGDSENPTSGTNVEASQVDDTDTYVYDCTSISPSYFVLTNGDGAGYLTSIVITHGGGSSYSNFTTLPIATTVISITTPEGYSTFMSKKAVVMPEGLTGSVAVANGEELSWNEMYKAGDVVPALTPILVKGPEAVADYDANVAYGGEEPATNYLYANTTDATKPASDIAEGAEKFYVLSYDKSNENIGFYWLMEGGASFNVPAGKVFLAIPGNVQAKAAFRLVEESTGINAVKNANAAKNAAYNLNGQRVNANAKGIVIVNGKKVLNK